MSLQHLTLSRPGVRSMKLIVFCLGQGIVRDPEIRRGFLTGVLLALSFLAPACHSYSPAPVPAAETAKR